MAWLTFESKRRIDQDHDEAKTRRERWIAGVTTIIYPSTSRVSQCERTPVLRFVHINFKVHSGVL